MSSNSHKEDAAISESSGSSYASGTALQLEESVDAEKFAEEEVLSESESVDNELLDAEVRIWGYVYTAPYFFIIGYSEDSIVSIISASTPAV